MTYLVEAFDIQSASSTLAVAVINASSKFLRASSVSAFGLGYLSEKGISLAARTAGLS